MLHYDKQLKVLSRNLRENSTDAERHLWSKPRGKQMKGLQFYRQKVTGRYIVDFYCAKAGLVIEVDGRQHYEEGGKEKDLVRDEFLRKSGLTVLRFSDREVFEDTDAGLAKIWNFLRFLKSPDAPLCQRGGGAMPADKAEDLCKKI
jgi:very-short-patch-repair endonuclease